MIRALFVSSCLVALTACETVEATEPTGATARCGAGFTVGEQACLARVRELEAIAAGASVTRCTPVGSQVSCITY